MISQFQVSKNCSAHVALRSGLQTETVVVTGNKLETAKTVQMSVAANMGTIELLSSKSSARTTAAVHVGQNSSAHVARSVAAVWTLIPFK